MSTKDAEKDSSTDTECPTCGRDDFDSRADMKIHHSHAHGESIAGVSVNCHWCSDVIKLPPSKANRSERHFCKGTDCYQQWQSENNSGADSWHWDDDAPVLSCDWCGESFRPSPGRADEARFCKEECYGKWVSENLVGENATNWRGGGTPCTCIQCGNDFISRNVAYDTTRAAGKFCEEECYGAWLSENNVGKNHPRWEGGEIGYGEGWNKAKKETVRERDGYECVVCGMTGAEHREQYGWALEVHHIIPARMFDGPEERNDPSNLVSLCRDDHQRWEGIPLRPDSG